MPSPKCVIFHSDPQLIKRSGDNCGYIYNPSALMYLGESFNIQPGEPVMIIPHQPDQQGPWKQYRTAFEDGRFLKCKDEENLVIMLENRFPNQLFRVTRGCTLSEILNNWGVNHALSFASDSQLEKIEAYELIITLDDTDDENDDKPAIKLNIKSSKKCCQCQK